VRPTLPDAMKLTILAIISRGEQQIEARLLLGD
jgi:hypothetical protein